MASRRLSELALLERRRRIGRSVLVILLAWVVLIGVYYVLPFDSKNDSSAVVRFVLGGIVFATVLALQVRNILKADIPELRSVEALGVIIPLFLVTFAGIYLTLAHASPTNFSTPLNHTGALYFTITVLSTVGFGDITPRNDLPQIIVSIQMLFDLVLVVVVIRLLALAARTGLQRGS